MNEMGSCQTDGYVRFLPSDSEHEALKPLSLMKGGVRKMHYYKQEAICQSMTQIQSLSASSSSSC